MQSQYSSKTDALDRFEAMLRTSDSATATLEQWVNGAQEMRTVPSHPPLMLCAHMVPVPSVLPSADQIARLEVADASELCYRRVRLVCAGLVMSDAENWYVPARLTPAMRHALESTATPFGRVIESLNPTRETLACVRLWSPDNHAAPSHNERLPTCLLQYSALVRESTGRPICEVSEVYTRNIVCERKA